MSAGGTREGRLSPAPSCSDDVERGTTVCALERPATPEGSGRHAVEIQMTTPPAFCPDCGTRRLPDARFCGGCGADLGGAAPTPAVGPSKVLRPGGAGPAEAAPGVVVTPPSPRPPARARRPSRTPLLVATALALVLVPGGAGLWWLLHPSAGPTGSPDGSPFPSPIALTSPPASRAPQIADPDTPAYQAASGFTPDAVRVLTVTVLQLSLERYHDDVGTYPTTLDALFPSYAPAGPDGQPMSGPPAVTDGYSYTGSGDTYTLSVVLAGGAPYVVTAPAGR